MGSAGPSERTLWTREQSPRLFHPCGGLGSDELRCNATQCALGADLVWADHRNRPTWIPSPAGPIPSWGHKHTSECLGAYLSALMRELGPFYVHAQWPGAEGHAGCGTVT